MPNDREGLYPEKQAALLIQILKTTNSAPLLGLLVFLITLPVAPASQDTAAVSKY